MHSKLLIFVSALLCPLTSHAQAYPSKPIRMVVPQPPGGTSDILARALAQKMSEGLHQTIVVDNRPGASGTIGTDLVAKAPPDGYTIAAIYTTHATTASLHARLPYDPVNDFSPITLAISVPLLLVVRPQLAVTSVKDLIALARAKPGALNFCSAGNGSGSHLAGELFKTMTKTDITHVPYKGSGPAIVDLLGGQVQLMFAGMVPIEPHVKSGRLRGIAVSSSKRAAAMPQFPTVAESGLPGFEVVPWYAFVAPAKTPKAIVDVLHREIVNALQTPEIRDKLAREGAEAVGSSPAEFGAYLKADVARWAAVIRKSGAKVD
jgi:tripartite-type tricarboxylate transporter receptor subunit TctC